MLILGGQGRVLKETCHIIRGRLSNWDNGFEACGKTMTERACDREVEKFRVGNTAIAWLSHFSGLCLRKGGVIQQTCKSTFVGSPRGNSPVRHHEVATMRRPAPVGGFDTFPPQIPHDSLGGQPFPCLAAYSSSRYLAQREPWNLATLRIQEIELITQWNAS
jgi:hypothetical protein